MGFLGLFGRLNRNKSVNPAISPGFFKDGNTLGDHSLVLSRNPNIVIPEKQRYEHAAILGAPGKGKTVLLKNIIAQDILSGAGAIVVDPKNDLKDFMLRATDLSGRIVDDDNNLQFHSFTISGSDSETWNPLHGKDPIRIANRLHTALFAEDINVVQFYKDVAGNLLRNLIKILMSMNKPIVLKDVFMAVMDKEILGQIVRQVKNNDEYKVEARDLTKDFLESKDSEAHKLTIGLKNKLQQLVSSPWSKYINSYEPDINVQEIIEKGHILHFGVASDIIGRDNYQPLMRLFLAHVRQAAGERYQKNIKKPCFFYCDEFGDVASDDFLDGIKKYRSAGIGFTIGFQDLGDLTRRGEHYLVQTMTNCATKFIFNSPEPNTADYMAKLLGTYQDTTISAQSYNSKGEIKGQSEKLDDRKFKIAPDTIKNLDRGYCIGIMPYLYKGEYAIYKFRSRFAKEDDFPEADYDFYHAFWKDINKDEEAGLNLYKLYDESQEEDEIIKDNKPSKRKIKKMENEEDAPDINKLIDRLEEDQSE